MSLLERQGMRADWIDAAPLVRRCVTLQEKIDLFAMIQKIDISNLSFSSDARTEDDVDRVFMQRSGMIPMLITGARETVGSRGSTAQGRRSRMQSANSNSASFASENGVPRSGRPPTADDAAMVVYRQGEREKERDERPRAQSAASTISEARQEVRSIEVEALEHKIAVTQAKAASEEKARLAAQERAVSLAEQLLDKEKEIANLQTLVTSGEKTLSKSKKPSRDRSIQHDKTLKLQNKMRDIETEMQKYENKLSEKEEECRIKARKIAELLFKLQVEEDSNLRIQDQIIDLKGQIKKKDEEVTRLAAAAHRDRDEPHGSPRSGQNNVAATRQQQQQQPQSSSSVSSRITNQTLIAQQEAQSGHSSPTRSRSLSSRPGSAEAPTSVTSPPQKGKSPMEQPVSPIQRPLSPPVDTSRPNSGQGRPRTSAGSGDRGAAGGGGDQTWAGGHLEGGSAEGPPDVLTMKTISE